MLIGRHKGLSMMEGIDRNVDGVVFVGYHTGAGAGGVLAHTYLPNTITGVWLDDVPASEGRLNARLAEESECRCSDAEGYAPDARRVAVKECVTRYAAVCRPPAVTSAAIQVAAAEAMASAGRRVAVGQGSHRIEVESTPPTSRSPSP